MSEHKKLKFVESWVYTDGYMYNIKNKHLVEVGNLCHKDVNNKFIQSDSFKKLVISQPQILHKKANAHEILALEITNKCNYACPYCFEGNSRTNKDILQFDIACATINKLPERSELRFFGGEPLLEFFLIKKIVEKYSHYKYSIVTNGSLITKEIAQFLSEHNFSVGISFDGAQWQKKNRPNPCGNSMKDAENAIKHLSDAKVNFGISTVITQESIPHLYDIHLEMFDEYPIGGWAYLIAYNKMMKPAVLDIFRENLLNIIDDFPAIHLLRINDLKKWAMKITGEWPTNTYCGAGAGYKALSAHGEEKFCTFFLRESSCHEPKIGTIEVNCKQCNVWNFCHGGCLALNLYGSGTTYRSHPFACKKNHIYFEAGLKTRIKVKHEIESKLTQRMH